MYMPTSPNSVEAGGSLSLETAEGGFADLAEGDYACITVWGTVQTNENGQLALAVEEAELMPSDQEGGDSEESEGELEEEPETQPAAAALKRPAKSSKPPASVLSVMIGRPAR